jgi:hypothetical protein
MCSRFPVLTACVALVDLPSVSGSLSHNRSAQAQQRSGTLLLRADFYFSFRVD